MPDGTRRDKPAFEPPPWEREAFDELARKRAEEEERRRAERQADSEAAQRWAEQARAAAAQSGPPEAPAQQAPAAQDAPEAPLAGSYAAPAVTPDAAPEAVPAPAADKPALDEKQVQAMLLQLSGEEPDLRRAARPLTRWMAIVVGAIGVVMFGLAVYFTSKGAGQAIGVMGGLIVGVFAVFFVVVAIWMWVRGTRGKGS